MTMMLRPARPDDAGAIYDLFASSADDLTGMTSLPQTMTAAEKISEETSNTVAELATGSFEMVDGETRRLLFIIVDTESGPDGEADSAAGPVLGVTGMTFKKAVPNLAVRVTTSGDGKGLVMQSMSSLWTRTELDSSYLGPKARGRRAGTLLSRGRFMLLQIVRRQVPNLVVSHLRGVFDEDGNAPFWRCFGLKFAPEWQASPDAEAALEADPALLDGLAGHILELTAPVLDSLGAVNAASLPAYHLLRNEGLEPNGMYDPIDGGPTLVADISQTSSAAYRQHGRAVLGDPVEPVDGLISVATVDRFRVIRAPFDLTVSKRIRLAPAHAAALAVQPDALLAATKLGPVGRTKP